MSNNKKVNQGERAEELRRRKELEKLIEKTNTEITTHVDAAKEMLPSRSEQFLDYHKVKTVIDKESRDIVHSIAEFYLEEEIVEKVPYVAQKTKVDHMSRRRPFHCEHGVGQRIFSLI